MHKSFGISAIVKSINKIVGDVTRVLEQIFKNQGIRNKIALAFTAICMAVIIGLSYILYDLRTVHNMSNELVNRHQPVAQALRYIVQNIDHAKYDLQVYLLTGEKSYVAHFKADLKETYPHINQLETYISEEAYNIKRSEISNIKLLLHDISGNVENMQKVGENYAENYVIISAASSDLNPLALEYLGIINSMLDEERDEPDLKTQAHSVGLLTDIRHSWTQMMSFLRIDIATRRKSNHENVYSYLELNKQLLQKLQQEKNTGDFGQVAQLIKLNATYSENLKKVLEKLDSDIWRLDIFIMKQHIVPTFDELDSIIYRMEDAHASNLYTLNNQLGLRLDSTNNTYLLVILITFILSAFTAFALTRHIKKRLSSLQRVSERVAEGNFMVRADDSIADEIGNFSNCFNKMLGNIDLYQRELYKAKEAAEAASEAKSRFLSRMSHELRTPLNSIIGFSELTANSLNKLSFQGKEEIEEYTSLVHKSGRHLLKLVNEILDLARIAADEIEINLQPTHIRPIIEECIETVRPMLADKKLSINSSLDEANHILLNIDKGRLKQVMLNLLSNAINYNREHGRIDISCQLKPDGAFRICVNDSGIGIADEDKDKVFEAFNRLDADKRAIDGIGIGLTISKTYIMLMRGKIGVDSIPGQGASFWIELPAVKSERIVDMQSRPLEDDPCRHTILYIEDDHSNQILINMIFLKTRPEFNLIIAGSGEEGIKLAKQHHPDLILMDIDLPGMDGEQAMQALRSDPLFKDTPFIAVSADAMKKNIKKRLEAGFNNYVTKPVDMNTLLSACDALLNISRD
jgi:signal transduction histidine kinase/CHASE3 domain sensor protein